MTPEQIELHRMRFEEIAFLARNELHINRRSLFRKTQESVYCSNEIEHKWQGYLMSIESIEIEFPMPVLYRDGESSDEHNHRYSYNTALNHALQNIQSLGLKVKER